MEARSSNGTGPHDNDSVFVYKTRETTQPWRNVLRRCRSQIRNSIDEVDLQVLIDELLSQDVIFNEHQETINSQQIRNDKLSKLLDLLMQKGEKSCEKFVMALRTIGTSNMTELYTNLMIKYSNSVLKQERISTQNASAAANGKCTCANLLGIILSANNGDYGPLYSKKWYVPDGYPVTKKKLIDQFGPMRNIIEDAERAFKQEQISHDQNYHISQLMPCTQNRSPKHMFFGQIVKSVTRFVVLTSINHHDRTVAETVSKEMRKYIFNNFEFLPCPSTLKCMSRDNDLEVTEVGTDIFVRFERVYYIDINAFLDIKDPVRVSRQQDGKLVSVVSSWKDLQKHKSAALHRFFVPATIMHNNVQRKYGKEQSEMENSTMACFSQKEIFTAVRKEIRNAYGQHVTIEQDRVRGTSCLMVEIVTGICTSELYRFVPVVTISLADHQIRQSTTRSLENKLGARFFCDVPMVFHMPESSSVKLSLSVLKEKLSMTLNIPTDEIVYEVLLSVDTETVSENDVVDVMLWILDENWSCLEKQIKNGDFDSTTLTRRIRERLVAPERGSRVPFLMRVPPKECDNGVDPNQRESDSFDEVNGHRTRWFHAAKIRTTENKCFFESLGDHPEIRPQDSNCDTVDQLVRLVSLFSILFSMVLYTSMCNVNVNQHIYNIPFAFLRYAAFMIIVFNAGIVVSNILCSMKLWIWLGWSALVWAIGCLTIFALGNVTTKNGNSVVTETFAALTALTATQNVCFIVGVVVLLKIYRAHAIAREKFIRRPLSLADNIALVRHMNCIHKRVDSFWRNLDATLNVFSPPVKMFWNVSLSICRFSICIIELMTMIVSPTTSCLSCVVPIITTVLFVIYFKFDSIISDTPCIIIGLAIFVPTKLLCSMFWQAEDLSKGISCQTVDEKNIFYRQLPLPFPGSYTNPIECILNQSSASLRFLKGNGDNPVLDILQNLCPDPWNLYHLVFIYKQVVFWAISCIRFVFALVGQSELIPYNYVTGGCSYHDAVIMLTVYTTCYTAYARLSGHISLTNEKIDVIVNSFRIQNASTQCVRLELKDIPHLILIFHMVCIINWGLRYHYIVCGAVNNFLCVLLFLVDVILCCFFFKSPSTGMLFYECYTKA